MITYRESLNELRLLDSELASILDRLPNLEAVLNWAPSLTGVDSIQQDEYNYDVLLPWQKQWLAFGIT